ncbi:MAG: hypothetical protein K0R38_6455 [Polyangiaceae bacterium]|jgi:hypothetical protein|nr:hypothetical protein [Polyangiaceae bacterium]
MDRPDILRIAERVGVGYPDELEALVVDTMEQHGRAPSVVADFVEVARASAGGVRLTVASSAGEPSPAPARWSAPWSIRSSRARS